MASLNYTCLLSRSLSLLPSFFSWNTVDYGYFQNELWYRKQEESIENVKWLKRWCPFNTLSIFLRLNASFTILWKMMALLWIMLSTDVLLVRERPVRVSSAVYSSGWGRKVGKILQPASRPSHIDVVPRPPESSIFPRLTHCYALRREVGSCLSFKCPSQTKKQVKKKIKSRKRRFNQIGSKKKGRLTIVYYGLLCLDRKRISEVSWTIHLHVFRQR